MSTPSKLIKKMLDGCYWPETLEPMKQYHRYEDDSPNGGISVVIGNDGDTHFSVMSEVDPKDLHFTFRFRMPIVGGGESPRVRNALLILAEAIRLDNIDHPQSRED